MHDTARLIAFDNYISWYSELSLLDADAVYKKYSKAIEALQKSDRSNPVSDCLREMFTVTGGWASHPPSETREAKWPGCRGKMAQKLRRYREFAIEFEQNVRVLLWKENEYAYLYLGNPDKGILVTEPEKYLERIPEKDYADLTPAAVRTLLGAPPRAQEPGLIPASAESSMTKAGVTQKLERQKDAIEALNKQMDDVKGAKTEELAKLQAKIKKMQEELDTKKHELMAQMKEKMAQMQEMKENLENQIYLLDSQIYCIRCYAGEVVRFAKILSGKNAPVTEPIVIHQKLHFLDEELGLLASLYEIQWDEIGMFEDFLKHSPLALDTFAPNQRCITLVRLSRSATSIGRSSRTYYTNMLEDYEYYHGKTVGIIVRNGDNVYLGWTEEERVHIDDDLIVSKIITEITPEDELEPKFIFESDRERYIKNQKEQKKKIMDGIISRSFVYNILQGLVDNTPILPLPAGVQLNRPSEYVVYSVADKWLTDDRYGNFTEIVRRCNEKISKGDMLLTVQKLIPEHNAWDGRHYHGHDRAWDNARGRGEANRTHDCSVDDCTIYPVNLIEFDEPVSKTRYRALMEPDSFIHTRNPESKPYWQDFEMTTEEFEKHVKRCPAEQREVIETFEYRKRHVFVSVKKTDPYRWDGYQGDARANFELYKEEYINLTYLNSVWLEWVITNKKLGGWTVGGKLVDYAYAIRYLKTAMDFIRERESREKAILDAIDTRATLIPEWQVRLSEWKLEAGVREITEYQAKRFVKVFLGGAGKA